HHEELQVLVDEEAVLVVVALLAHIGQPSGHDLQPDRRWLGWGHADGRWYRPPSGPGKETARFPAGLRPPVARAGPSGREVTRRAHVPREPGLPPRPAPPGRQLPLTSCGPARACARSPPPAPARWTRCAPAPRSSPPRRERPRGRQPGGGG